MVCLSLVAFLGLFMVVAMRVGGCSGKGKERAEMGENGDGFGIYYFICRYIFLMCCLGK